MKEQQAANNHQSGPAMTSRSALLLVLAVFIIAAALAVTGILPRVRARAALQEATNALAAPAVLVEPPQLGEPEQNVVLPGTIEAYTDAAIYARTNGYLRKWYFDIGAHVRKGQLLAQIESPEVDQQLAQAKADLLTAQANAGNAQATSARYQDLLRQNAVSAQDTENFRTQAAASNTQVRSAQANMQRLQELVSFEKIYAPFDGIITARSIDIGQLINAGAGTASSGELFHLSDIHLLRVYVNVPQIYSPGIRPGIPAQLTFSEFPGRSFPGRVVRSSRAIDPASRTLLVEVDVDNRKGELVAGAYTQVHFSLITPERSLILPVSTLMFRSEGLHVATVINGKAHLVPITIGRDDGRVVEIVQGLQAGDQVIQNPPDSLIEGEEVRVVPPLQSGARPS